MHGVPWSRLAWKVMGAASDRLTASLEWPIPTGEDTTFEGFDGPLGDAVFDDGFALAGAGGAFTLSGRGRKVTVDFVSGYPFAQVFAPAGQESDRARADDGTDKRFDDGSWPADRRAG